MIQHNSHITGAGTVSLDSGNDTNLRGAQVVGKAVIADIGRDLNIASRQDTVHARNKSDSYSIGAGADKARNTSSAYNMGDWDVGYGKDRSKYDYASVIEQPGIYAGADGFDIKVKNNTDLKGAVIASGAEAAKNRLETGSLTTSDIENYAHAEAKTEGFGWTGGMDPPGLDRVAAAKADKAAVEAAKARSQSGKTVPKNKWQSGGDPTKTGFEGKFWDSEYGAAKNIISNLLDNGSASKTTHGETKSAVAAGTVVITDAEAQQAKTGLTPEESIARLRRDTEGTQTAAAQIDLGKIERQAQDERAMKKGIFDNVVRHSDQVYESYVNEKADLYEIAVTKEGKALVDEDGKVIMRKLTLDELYELKKSGKLNEAQVFTNGINNDENMAGTKAVVMASDKSSPVYVIYNPYTGNGLSEVMAAAYSKVFESDAIGLSNVTKKVKEIQDIYGADGLHLYGHSRGSLSIQNAMNSQLWDQKHHGKNVKDLLSGTDITYYGGAANAANGYERYKALGGKGSFGDESNKYDIVSRADFMGWNPITFGQDGDFYPLKKLSEWKRIFSDETATSHGCYGPGAVANCNTRYGDRYVKEYNRDRLRSPEEKKTGMVKETDYINRLGQKKGPRK